MADNTNQGQSPAFSGTTTYQQKPVVAALYTYAGHNVAQERTWLDYKPIGGVTEEGITFDNERHALSTDSQYSAVYSYGDTNILALAFPRNGKRAVIRGWEQPTDFPDIYHLGIYGQSNASFADALPVVSGAFQNLGNVKFVCGVQTWNFIWGPTYSGAAARGRAMFDLVPLYEQDHQNGQGESWSTGLSAQFKLNGAGGRYNTGNLENSKPHMLFSNSSTGGIYLSALMPADPEAKGYYLVFKDDIARGMDQAARAGMTYGFGGVLFEQGESEASSLKLTPSGSAQPFTTVQNTWRDNLVALRAAMDADVKTITGQTRAMPMFAACGRYPLLGNALKQAAALDPNIILTTPLHFAPNAMNSQLNPLQDPGGRKYGDVLHITADGTRWIGEQKGKQMARLLKHGVLPKVMMVKDVWRVDNNTINVQFDVPYKPLKIDSAFTFPVQNMGFRIFAGVLDTVGALATITGTSILNEDTVQITTSTTIAASSNFLVEYLGEKIGPTSAAVLESIQDGAAYANGNATKEAVFNGDVRSQFLPAMCNGLIYLFQNGVAWNPVIRDIRFAGGKTILRGDANTFDGTQTLGAVVRLSAPFATGGICDSDPALSIYQFTDTTYGTNQGKYYPLWNYAFPFIQAVRT
jgi:hypothetical protein